MHDDPLEEAPGDVRNAHHSGRDAASTLTKDGDGIFVASEMSYVLPHPFQRFYDVPKTLNEETDSTQIFVVENLFCTNYSLIQET